MTKEKIIMKAIVVTDQAAGTAGMTQVERPEPRGFEESRGREQTRPAVYLAAATSLLAHVGRTHVPT
jgi:hypothetical protein